MMIILNSFDDFLNPEHAKTPPDHLCDDRGGLNYLVELDRIELTAS